MNVHTSTEPLVSLLCPTRGRPQSMHRFLDSVQSTTGGRVEIVWYIDEDDQESRRTADELQSETITTIVGPRLVLSETWNRCAAQARGEILGHMGDDIVFGTRRWERIVVQAFERYRDRIVFVHGDDRLQGRRLGTHGFLHRNWVNTLGRFVPPYFAHDYNDTWLTEVADMIGRRVYLPELITEHLHPDAGKAVYDQTYRDHADAGARENVTALYAQLRPEREQDAAKLRAVMLSS